MKEHHGMLWNTLSGKEFEAVTAKLLKSRGLTIGECSSGPDGGIDMVARSSDPIAGGLFIVQCKRQQAKVGAPVVRDLLGVVSSRKANKGILITTSDFTSAARAFAHGNPIELVNGLQFSHLLKDFEGDSSELRPFGAMLPFEAQEFLVTIRSQASEIATKIRQQDDELSKGLRILKVKRMRTLVESSDFIAECLERLGTAIQTISNQSEHLFDGLQHTVAPKEVDRRFGLYRAAIDEIMSLQLILCSVQPMDDSDVQREYAGAYGQRLEGLRIAVTAYREGISLYRSILHLTASVLEQSLVQLVQATEEIEHNWPQETDNENDIRITIPWVTDFTEVSAEIGEFSGWMNSQLENAAKMLETA